LPAPTFAFQWSSIGLYAATASDPTKEDHMKYYGFWRSLAACRVRIALALKGIAAEEISVNLMQGEQLQPAYREVNPLGVVPALVIDDGSPLFERSHPLRQPGAPQEPKH
jgi:hypothetical protein